MHRRKIPLFKIAWDGSDLRSVARAIQAGGYWAKGKSVEEFERAIARSLKARYCVVFNSGTSALHALLLAHGLGRGDEIIVPSFTFITTAAATLYVQATPVFAEIDEETLGLDPRSVRAKLTTRTKAIITVHYGGNPCRIHKLRALARQHGLILIEDAAGALGASVEKRMVGTFGDSAIFSFCQNKIVTTGEGGCAVTRSRKVYEALRLIRSHGEHPGGEREGSVSLGFNFRMSSLSAALGVSQMKKLDRNIRARRKIARRLHAGLRDVNGLRLPAPLPRAANTFHLYPVRVQRGSRDGLMRHLARRGSSSKVYFPPVHLSDFFRKRFGYRRGALPVTETIGEEILCLPIYPQLTTGEADYLIETVRNFFQGAHGGN